jgi:hypothetical protein
MKLADFLIKIFVYLCLFLVLLCFNRCKKLVDVDPPSTSVTGANVYNSDATAIAVLTGLYIQISGSPHYSNGLLSISKLAGLSADELTLWSGVNDISHSSYYKNELFSTPASSAGTEMWYNLYPLIYKCNTAIEGLSNAVNLSPAVQRQLIGEAKFMRSLFYFYLINLYGDIPLILNTDYKANEIVPRSSIQDVYHQIVEDLKEAQELLSDVYLDGSLLKQTLERVRPTKWAATSLLSRTYLFMGDWVNAEMQSTQVINSNLYSLDSLNGVFLKNSNEAIFQLQPVGFNNYPNTQDAVLFILPASGPSRSVSGNPVYLSTSLISSFEADDKRKLSWVTSIKTSNGSTFHYASKYKINKKSTATLPVIATEYSMVLRLAEQYLIRAEARAQQDNIQAAKEDLNKIRNRAGLNNTAATDKKNLVEAIIDERRVELFLELGHRWIDLKRTDKVNGIMNLITPIKSSGKPWRNSQQLYPIPYDELNKNKNLHPNPGY